MASSSRKNGKRKNRVRFSLSRESRRKLLGALLVAAGAATALSLLFPNGGVAQRVSFILEWVAGWGAMVLPVGLLWMGGLMVRRGFDPRFLVRRRQVAGACLLALSFLGLIHFLPIGTADAYLKAENGQGGGHLGLLVSGVLRSNLGGIGSLLLLLAGALAGAFLVWSIHPVTAARWLAAVPPALWHACSSWRARRRKVVLINPAQQPPAVQKAPVRPQRAPEPTKTAPVESADVPATGNASLPAGVATDWVLPPMDIFEAVPVGELSHVDIKQRIKVINDTLKSFGVDAQVVEVNQGPAVTQFGVEPGVGVKVNRIIALGNDLALHLAAAPLRIEAPVPGKHVVGIEVPNGSVAVVSIRELLESPAFESHRGRLKLALGRDVSGTPVVADLARMPHLLIAGATGSGKSVCLNSFIAALLKQMTPRELRLLMIDPKMVELLPFNGVPHLMAPVVTDMEKVIPTLKWAVREMERRYSLFAARGVRNVDGYNRAATGRGSDLPLPYIVVIIDELADLMMTAPDEAEKVICRLAQLARATGIHLVVATQRPSVDVVTGLIKANFPTRISFAVTSMIDSRVILDQPGAERLLGRGDMLYVPPDAIKPIRIQGTFVSDEEIRDLVRYWKDAKPPGFTGDLPGGVAFEPVVEEEVDDLYEDAKEVVAQHSRVSASLLQRRLGIGYNRASRLIDRLENEGLIGPSENGKSREVLMREETSAGDVEQDAEQDA